MPKLKLFNFPVDFATTIDTAASPVTLTTVRHISSGLSTAKIAMLNQLLEFA